MAKSPTISFEFFPPRTDEGVQKLKDTVTNLNVFNPEFYSVTFGAGGSTREKTLETVMQIKAMNANAVPHISCISSSKDEVHDLIMNYQAKNINHLVALRGDNPSGVVGEGDFNHANELVEFIRQETGNFFKIEVAAYPEFHPESLSAEQDLDNFKKKIDAGADGAITQFFFNVDAYFKFMEECDKRKITIPITPGIMPIYNIKQLSRFASNCGAEIPRWLRLKLEGFNDDLDSLRDYGVEVISELCQTLIQYEVPSIHFYTLNKSKTVSRIIKNLHL
ncbi:MAG: methylenetetrahydrofolate reductase [NAD(P)H] [Proteobacteria bacterium]|jgi:methylenetetrahydrofolate reductase (NADPH)|nr:methylenetetrahydrofolate reductase [NAD(P)H] [Pseudomonadota bacterium]MDA0872953.1 methylenetetrahydrofolate reductase [NAD(P)H] [Pseudomonadota bacterium]MDA1134442.1 methylenetetrahydrofolate reductase [NAD(P)H] [Pseudomonadota bacterium]